MTRRIGVLFILAAFCTLFVGCKISGTISENGVGLMNVNVSLSGNVVLTTTTNSSGYYEFNDISILNRTYTVTPVSYYKRFSPQSQEVNVGIADVTGVDFLVVTDALETYRKSIPIVAGSGTGADYQVRVRVGESTGAQDYDVQLEGHCQTNFADVRFTDDDGETLLECWLESVSGFSPEQTATFWVRVHDNLDSNRQIFIYYGDEEAESASNGDATFDFFDDFEDEFNSLEAAVDNAPDYLNTPTYDDSGQAIHPDVVYFPSGWNEYAYWMAMTPYPGSDDDYENPSILASNDGETWVVPSGLTNPLADAPVCDHNNDTDLIYNTDTGELWLYYLETRRASKCGGSYNDNALKLFKSSDGVNWNGPTILIEWNLNDEPLYLSPSVVQLDSNEFYLWMTNGSDEVLFYESTDGKTWGIPQAVNIAENVWHMNVSYIPEKDEFWMLTQPASADCPLRWAVSTDGINWTTYPNRPVISPSVSGWDTTPYRGSFLYDAASDQLQIWYSAYTRDPSVIWHTGYVEADYSDFLDSLLLANTGEWSIYNTGGSWATSSLKKKRGSLSGRLEQSSTTAGNKQIVYRAEPVANNFYLEWDMFDDGEEEAFKLVRINSGTLGSQTGIGVYTPTSVDNYVYHSKGFVYTETSVVRTLGWSKFGIKLTSDATASYFINDTAVGSNTGQFASGASISVEGYYTVPTVFYVDDIRVRKAAAIDPTIGTPGAEQEGSWLLY